MGIFGKILVAVNFVKFRETFKKHEHKKTFEIVQRNFMKILLKLQKYMPQIVLKFSKKKFEKFESGIEKILENGEINTFIHSWVTFFKHFLFQKAAAQ